MDLDVLKSLQDLYQQMDQSSRDFQSRTGIACLNQCGRCCLNPEIEATPLEMLPMAWKIFQEGEVETWLHQLENVPEGSPCLVYQAPAGRPHQGHCRYYHQRPTLCRLFGYMVARDKQAKKKLSLCKYIKEEMAGKGLSHLYQSCIEENNDLMDQGPFLPAWVERVKSLATTPADNQRMPINQALLTAIGKLGIYLTYQDTQLA